MTAPTPAPTDCTAIWTGGTLPARGGRIIVNGQPAILVDTRPRNAVGTPIMYREVRG